MRCRIYNGFVRMSFNLPEQELAMRDVLSALKWSGIDVIFTEYDNYAEVEWKRIENRDGEKVYNDKRGDSVFR